MVLNEYASKIDGQLDIACKKFEKICKDSGSQDQFTIEMKDEKDDTKTIQSKDPIGNFFLSIWKERIHIYQSWTAKLILFAYSWLSLIHQEL